MSRAEEFLRLYNELANHLAKKINAGHHTSFMRLVDFASRKDPQVRARKDDLRDFADLRNAIIHHRAYPDEIIAEPNVSTIRRFRRISREIMKPRLVFPTFKRKIMEFPWDIPLQNALEYMKANDFSQIVIRDRDDNLNLLTNEGVSKWLADVSLKGMINVSDFVINDALAFEDKGQFLLMQREETVSKARDAFDNSTEPILPELWAIIITHSAKPHEKSLGIITPWDMLDVKNL
jgi:CBS domain-containing protein